MKKQGTIDSLDRELRNAAIAMFVVAAIYLPVIPYYIIVQNSYARLATESSALPMEIAAKMVTSLRVIFFFTVPMFCFLLILLGTSLLRNFKQRKQLKKNNGTEPSH